MASWKKVIVSGSAAELSSLTLDTALPVAQGGIGATSLTDKAVLISQDSGTDAVGAVALTSNGQVIIGGSDGPAAATISGTSNEITVTNGANSITLSQPDDVTIGQDLVVTRNLKNSSAVSDSHITGSFTGSFVGDGSNLSGTALDIDALSALGGTGLHQTQDHFVFSDNGTEKKITFSNLEDAIFGNVSGDATIAAGGALTIGANAVEGSMLNSNVAGTGLDYGSDELSVDVSDFMTNGVDNRVLTATGADGQNAEANLTFDGTTLTVNGNLEVAGTQTTVNSTNLLIEDRFVLLNSGSSATGDGGILVGSGSAYSSSAFIFDDSEDRWGVQIDTQLGSTAATAIPEAYSSLLVLNAHTGSSTYTKNGNLRIDDSGNIFIYVE
jgi:hypothetical protein